MRVVKRVRVLIGGVPSTLRALIVDTLTSESSVDLVVSDPPEAVEPRDIDVVLVGADDPHDLQQAGLLLSDWPRARIVVVSHCGRDAVMYEWYPHKIVFGDVAPGTLLSVIRQGCGLPC